MRIKFSCLTVFALLAISFAQAQDQAPSPTATPTAAPTPQHEGALAAEFRLEHDRFSAGCIGFKSPAGCAQVLFTDHPMHIAVGSIAPQNGFGAGLALVTHQDLKNYYLKEDFDAMGSTNGSWRAGAYLKIIPTKRKPIVVVHGPSQGHGHIFARPLITLYAQAISLNKLGFFGLGPLTGTGDRSFFGMRETIAGAHAIVPISLTGRLNLSLVGEMNGRFIDIRGSHGQDSPSIEQLYTPITAPGLASQPGFLQFGEGLRVNPSLGAHLTLNYLVTLEEYIAPSDSTFSFRRYSVNLDHTIPLYGTRPAAARDNNGPDECGTDDSKLDCPKIKSSFSRNLYGTLDFRFLLTGSVASTGSVVPFYLQPTLGGSDINGSPMLPSFQDYRFRAPNLMLLHAGLEHSIWGPFGFIFAAEGGKVALARDDIGLEHLSHSFGTGLTLRAGGVPMISLMFAWGGHEGNHTIANINTSLLGGSTRPSLF
jgi:hypothetical protein